jgi:hypothetical protein
MFLSMLYKRTSTGTHNMIQNMKKLKKPYFLVKVKQ